MIYAKWQRCFISAMFRQIQHPSRIPGSRYDYQPSSEKCNVCALFLHSVVRIIRAAFGDFTIT